MVFIAHDLAVVKNVSDRVAVMYLGKLCEVARPDDLYHRPEHPYTEALLTSIPEPDPGASRNGKATLAGDLPSPINPPSGCRFRTRCPFAQQKCAEEEPQMRAVGPDHFVACHFPLGTHPATSFAAAASVPASRRPTTAGVARGTVVERPGSRLRDTAAPVSAAPHRRHRRDRRVPRRPAGDHRCGSIPDDSPDASESGVVVLRSAP